ncbi:hypothetical protein DES34_112146 [Brevibacillus brevis]|nr:hypothetical protein DES34_112146 [Brevibacillus brevis]VEF87175.1 Uncharacterised protein [Brevibacillus brevis]
MDIPKEKLARTTRPPAIRPITSGKRKKAVGYPYGSHNLVLWYKTAITQHSQFTHDEC